MKLVLAPDSFKGSLSALRVAEILRLAALRHFPGAQVVLAPIADGGEGTVEAVSGALGVPLRKSRVTGPLGLPVDAAWCLADDGTAVIEMAQAAGLPLVPAALRNPERTTTLGVGELILSALDSGAKSLVIGLGGSATNDGGMGMLRALGARFLGVRGADASSPGEVAGIDLSGLDPRLSGTEITAMCDVTNPLTGPEGASAIYGPQKGATSEQCARMDRALARYADALEAALGRDIRSFPGAGAAGGMGAALGGVLGARLRPGIDAVLDLAQFDRQLAGADLCLSGEGRLDHQSVRFGKAVLGVAKRCAAQGVPLAVVAGGLEGDLSPLYQLLDCSVMATVNAPMSLEAAMADAEGLLMDAAERMFRFVKLGMQIKGGTHDER